MLDLGTWYSISVFLFKTKWGVTGGILKIDYYYVSAVIAVQLTEPYIILIVFCIAISCPGPTNKYESGDDDDGLMLLFCGSATDYNRLLESPTYEKLCDA